MARGPVSGAQLALPVLVAAGLAFGESFASALIGPELPKKNDVAGAGAAIMFYLTFAVGFIVTAIALVVRRLIGRDLPERIALRSCVSAIGGGVIGAVSWSTFVSGVIIVAVLVTVPIAMAMPWPWDHR